MTWLFFESGLPDPGYAHARMATMLFPAVIAIDTNADTTDPIAAPGTVPLGRILALNAGAHRADNMLAPPSKVVLVASAACTVSVYAADDSTMASSFEQIPQSALDARRFWLVQSGLALTAAKLTAIDLPTVGCIYVKVTTPPAGAANIWAGLV